MNVKTNTELLNLMGIFRTCNNYNCSLYFNIETQVFSLRSVLGLLHFSRSSGKRRLFPEPSVHGQTMQSMYGVFLSERKLIFLYYLTDRHSL